MDCVLCGCYLGLFNMYLPPPDLTDLLKDEIKGPASFKCTNKECAFSGNEDYYVLKGSS